jgi:sugar lactone lactonase YvrE
MPASEGAGAILAMGDSLYKLDGDSLVPIAEGLISRSERFNDGVIDDNGLAVLGVVPRDRSTGGKSAVLIAGSGRRTLLDLGLGLPNGFALSDGEDALIISDTAEDARAIWSFDYLAGHGPGAGRAFARLERGRPDGGAFDATGLYWSCAIDAGAIVAIGPDGRKVGAVTVPVPRPTNLVFAGEAVFVTSMKGGDNDDVGGSVLRLERAAFDAAAHDAQPIPSN